MPKSCGVGVLFPTEDRGSHQGFGLMSICTYLGSEQELDKVVFRQRLDSMVLEVFPNLEHCVAFRAVSTQRQGRTRASSLDQTMQAQIPLRRTFPADPLSRGCTSHLRTLQGPPSPDQAQAQRALSGAEEPNTCGTQSAGISRAPSLAE